MGMALNSKRKFGFVDGLIPKPNVETDPDLANSWQCINDIICSWLFNCTSKDIAASVIYYDTAVGIWKDLQERFCHGNGPRIFQLKRELMSFKQGTFTITQYFTKIKAL